MGEVISIRRQACRYRRRVGRRLERLYLTSSPFIEVSSIAVRSVIPPVGLRFLGTFQEAAVSDAIQFQFQERAYPVISGAIKVLYVIRFGGRADTEQRAERGGLVAAGVEAEHELVEIGSQPLQPEAVVDAQRLRLANTRWTQGDTTCAAIGPIA